MQGTMPGARRREDHINTWTGLVKESIRMVCPTLGWLKNGTEHICYIKL